ncbi:MAG: hypothetical protein WCL18_00465 [bacterium]
MLFGEEIPMEEFHRQYSKMLKKSKIQNITSKIFKEILREYTTPLFNLYSERL